MLAAMTPIFVHDVSSIDVVEIDFTKEFRVTLTYLVLCLLTVGLVCCFLAVSIYLLGQSGGYFFFAITWVLDCGFNSFPAYVFFGKVVPQGVESTTVGLLIYIMQLNNFSFR